VLTRISLGNNGQLRLQSGSQYPTLAKRQCCCSACAWYAVSTLYTVNAAKLAAHMWLAACCLIMSWIWVQPTGNPDRQHAPKQRNNGECSRDMLYCATARPLRRRLTDCKRSTLLADTVVPRSALYLECASEKMAVVRQPCGKRRSVIEHVWLLALTAL
jgi:hypothetical protein